MTTPALALAQPVEQADDWTLLRACAGRSFDPDLMFPEDGDEVGVKAAKRICRECPVRTQCLTDALSRKEKYGVWGGLTRHERAALSRRRRPL